MKSLYNHFVLLKLDSLFFSCFYFLISICTYAQPFTHADTLRGSLNENRNWWDVMRYEISVKPNFEKKTIAGSVKIIFQPQVKFKNETGLTKILFSKIYKMQIDLQSPLSIDSVFLNNGTVTSKIKFESNKSVTLLYIDESYLRNLNNKDGAVIIYYHGKPREAIDPPWDGGWIWKKDLQGRPWMSVACQGLGASIWYPCKDHQSDEPDNGASLTITIPDTLMAVANGRLVFQSKANNMASYTWEVKNPINNYAIIPYIGKYVHFGKTYTGEKGKLDCDYWVLDYNSRKARQQFKEVPRMLKAFEYWFGPYPFYEDGYKLVEAPYLGMEHQSAIAYGNGYQNGYEGTDLSQTGIGLNWDYIIVHESGHEWFGNNITTKDIADMWVHEGFTNYSEILFTEYWFGKAAANKYAQGIRSKIKNDKPIIGQYGVNDEGSKDMYPKGASILHTIRQIINNDDTFRQILRGLNKTFCHQTVTTAQIENYISKNCNIDLSKLFDQYLRSAQIPILQWEYTNETLSVKWTNCIKDFYMPVRFLDIEGKYNVVNVNSQSWTSVKTQLSGTKDMWDNNMYFNKK